MQNMGATKPKRRRALDHKTRRVYEAYMGFETMDDARKAIPELSDELDVSPKSLGGYLTQASTNSRIADELLDAGFEQYQLPEWFAPPSEPRPRTHHPSPPTPRVQSQQEDVTPPHSYSDPFVTMLDSLLQTPPQQPPPTYTFPNSPSLDYARVTYLLHRFEETTQTPEETPPPQVNPVDWLTGIAPVGDWLEAERRNEQNQLLTIFLAQQYADNLAAQERREAIDSRKEAVKNISTVQPTEKKVTFIEPPTPLVKFEIPKELFEDKSSEIRKENLKVLVEFKREMEAERREKLRAKYPQLFPA